MWNENTEMVGWMKVQRKDDTFFFPAFRGSSEEAVSKSMNVWASKNEVEVLNTTILKFNEK